MESCLAGTNWILFTNLCHHDAFVVILPEADMTVRQFSSHDPDSLTSRQIA